MVLSLAPVARSSRRVEHEWQLRHGDLVNDCWRRSDRRAALRRPWVGPEHGELAPHMVEGHHRLQQRSRDEVARRLGAGEGRGGILSGAVEHVALVVEHVDSLRVGHRQHVEKVADDGGVAVQPVDVHQVAAAALAIGPQQLGRRPHGDRALAPSLIIQVERDDLRRRVCAQPEGRTVTCVEPHLAHVPDRRVGGDAKVEVDLLRAACHRTETHRRGDTLPARIRRSAARVGRHDGIDSVEHARKAGQRERQVVGREPGARRLLEVRDAQHACFFLRRGCGNCCGHEFTL
eukprot:75845-Prymnesium_polylepis.1